MTNRAESFTGYTICHSFARTTVIFSIWLSLHCSYMLFYGHFRFFSPFCPSCLPFSGCCYYRYMLLFLLLQLPCNKNVLLIWFPPPPPPHTHKTSSVDIFCFVFCFFVCAFSASEDVFISSIHFLNIPFRSVSFLLFHNIPSLIKGC